MRVLLGVLSCATLLGSDSAGASLRYNIEALEDGTRYVQVAGEFEFTDDVGQFISIVRTSGASIVTFHSPGGNALKAMEIGRAIRSLDLATIQPRASECASACALAFMAGVLRYAEPGAIGMHKSSFSRELNLSANEVAAAVQEHTADVMSYMAEMGVDPTLIQLALRYESHDVRYLSASEMEHYRVTTRGEAPVAYAPPQPSLPASPPPPQAAPSSLSPPVTSGPVALNIPAARSGKVRHPKGGAPVKIAADGKSATVANLTNGQGVTILGSSDRWYRVQVGQRSGFMHDTWVFVDQFESGPFAQRHIQVKSFDNLVEAEAFARSSPIPVTAYLATNGWFAITLRETYPQEQAKQLVQMMKEQGAIPDDSYVTYGNTYVRKVCCH